MGALSGTKCTVPVEMLVLTMDDIESLVTYKEAIEVEDQVYKAIGSGQVVQPQKNPMLIDPRENSNMIIVMPCYMKNLGIAGMKIVSDYFTPAPGLPTVWGAIVLLYHVDNGQPYAILDGTSITNIRTAAHSAIAAKYLAKKDSKIMVIIGTGAEARTHLRAFKEILPISYVKVFDIKPEAMTVFKQEIEAEFEVKVIPQSSVKEAVEDADVIAVTTTATKPVVMEPWVPAGCFVTGVMQFTDLDPALSKKADKWVIGHSESDPHLSAAVGVGPEVVDFRNAYADMGQIATGKKPGRENDKERTVYTHAGMASHDLALSDLVYRKAVKKGLGQKVRLI